ncbi:DUF3817 domain-containing protein [Xanthovirga aplysinae]|uniref:DUF3817 domain-containing protein n=1 Tax=Xanthovirga aplysinae TaxID=2529853 RepID=UPI0012BBDB0E|nr:DUF3817 domain-containing protein [Xanthovirga aplysinae]MTI30166.1 DUF3817 domain-containing protein [Xanthovirga aplysinae]
MDLKNLNTFRKIALLEGLSYLFLLLIAMPLKYFANMPEVVKYTGWAHGILFVAYCLFLLILMIQYKWSFGKSLWAFFASLLPFGTFVLDKQLKKEYAL